MYIRRVIRRELIPAFGHGRKRGLFGENRALQHRSPFRGLDPRGEIKLHCIESRLRIKSGENPQPEKCAANLQERPMGQGEVFRGRMAVDRDAIDLRFPAAEGMD